jgi:tetratricopeptide (TPR) repeat protein
VSKKCHENKRVTTHIINDAVMNCEQVVENQFAERYLLGQLEPADHEAFEQHYFECPRCFEHLQTHLVLCTELNRSVAAIRSEPVQRPIIWQWFRASAVLAVVLAVAMATWRWRQLHFSARNAEPGQSQSASTQIGNNYKTDLKTSAAAIDSRNAALLALAAVEPPVYTRVLLRGEGEEEKFEVAMRRYEKGDYGGAVSGLQGALKLDPDATEARFYLGISYLLTGQTDSAIENLRQVVSEGNSIYAESAHFYLAKAFIRKNNLASAQGEMAEVAALQRSHAAEARRSIEQLQALRSAPH